MQDPDLQRLLRAMDLMVAERGADLEVGGELERVALRLACLGERVGEAAQESAYLQFLRRCLQRAQGTTALAASA